jgi:hypothetical protein
MKIIITEEQSKLLRGIVGEQSGDDELDLFMKRRSSLIDELIDKNIDEVEEDETLFDDEFEFADNIIIWVVQDMKLPDDIDVNEIIEYIKDEYGDYIMSRFESDDDDDDDWDGYKDEIDEKWSQKFKKSIKCNNPKGFSQKAYCQGIKKIKLDE